MKFNKKIWIAIFMICFIFILVSCAVDKSETFTITWKNYDGTTLEIDEEVLWGSIPTYDGNLPTKSATDTHTFVFSGWSPEIVEVSENKTYTATYESKEIVINTYQVTWKNYDGTVLKMDDGLLEGDLPTYEGITPTKDATQSHTFIFSHWSPAPSPITHNNRQYTAVFAEEVIKFDVTVVIGEETTVYQVGYGANLDFLIDLTEAFAATSFLWTTWHDEAETTDINEWSLEYLSNYHVNQNLSIYGRQRFMPYQIISQDKPQVDWDRKYVYDPLTHTVIGAVSRADVPTKFAFDLLAGTKVIVGTNATYLHAADNIEFELIAYSTQTSIPVDVTKDAFGFEVIIFTVPNDNTYYLNVINTDLSEYSNEYKYNITATIILD